MNADPAGRGARHPDDREVTDRIGPLRYVVEGEARRVLADVRIAADPRRLAEGWERRFVADPARAAEAIQLYRAVGYETVADSVRPEDLGGDCGDCLLVAQLHLVTIYTRPAQPGVVPAGEDKPS
jgi:hypothetical protein